VDETLDTTAVAEPLLDETLPEEERLETLAEELREAIRRKVAPPA
jgi:hypothetical protein